MVPTSVSLLEQLRHHPDDAAWRRLFDLYDPLLRGWLRREGLDEADADDLTQETLTVVLRELPNFSHNGRTGAFRAWLRRIAVNRVRDFWRSKRNRPKTGGDLLDRLDQLGDPTNPLSRLWDEEHDRHVVQALMRRISEEFQPGTWAAFEGVMLRGEKPADAAKRLGVSVNAVLLAKSRILHRLRLEADGLI